MHPARAEDSIKDLVLKVLGGLEVLNCARTELGKPRGS